MFNIRIDVYNAIYDAKQKITDKLSITYTWDDDTTNKAGHLFIIDSIEFGDISWSRSDQECRT